MSNRLQYKHGRHTPCRPDRELVYYLWYNRVHDAGGGLGGGGGGGGNLGLGVRNEIAGQRRHLLYV